MYTTNMNFMTIPDGRLRQYPLPCHGFRGFRPFEHSQCLKDPSHLMGSHKIRKSNQFKMEGNQCFYKVTDSKDKFSPIQNDSFFFSDNKRNWIWSLGLSISIQMNDYYFWDVFFNLKNILRSGWTFLREE